MQIEKLIPMTAFVLAEEAFISQFYTRDARTIEPYNNIVRYAQFLTPIPTLGMFVPCDADGNVLLIPGSAPIYTHSENYIIKYNEAKSKVLFEGWSVIGQDDNVVEIEKDNENIWIDFFLKHNLTPCLKLHSGYEEDIHSIEELIQYDLKLTPTAKKQIYGR